MTESEAFWQNWSLWLTYIQKLFILVGMVIFMTIPKEGRRKYLEFGLIILAALLAEVAMTLLRRVLHTNQNPAANLLTLVNFPLAVLFYRRRINWPNKNVITIALLVPFVLYWLYNNIQNGITFLNSYSMTLEALGYIVLSVTYFYILIRELPAESITKLPMFWINAAILMYYSGTFVIYLSTDYLIKVLNNNLAVVWTFHNFLGLIFYSTLWYAMLLIRSEYQKRSE